MKEQESVLCYVSLPWAYFTTANLSQQWGDDWNDAPYEHNAGQPYEWAPYMAENGIQPYSITKVAFDAYNLLTPDYGTININYSVEGINAGVIPWLRHDNPKWCKHRVIIPAGTTLQEFIRLIHETGGQVYIATKADGQVEP